MTVTSYGIINMPSRPQPKLADRHRNAMRRFMEARQINPYSWAKSAKVSSSALYNFLNEDSDSLTSTTLAQLAEAQRTTISEILGEIDATSHTNRSSPQFPPHVLSQLKRWAEAEGMSVDQFVTLAVAEKTARLDAEAFYRAREGRWRALERMGASSPPVDGDELPRA